MGDFDGGDSLPPDEAEGVDTNEASRTEPRAAGVLEPPCDAVFPDESRQEAAVRADSRLRTLACREAALDLAIGRGLQRLTGEFTLRDLGHSRPQDFAPARLGFSWAHARELITLVTKLPELPRLRRAFLCGVLGRAKMRELVQVAEPATEDGWVVIGLRRSVRGVKDAIRVFSEGKLDPAPCAAARAAEDDADPDNRERVSWRTSPVNAAIWRGWGREMLRTVSGDSLAPDWKLAEMLSADTLARLGWDEGEDATGVRARSRRERPRRRRRLREVQLAHLARRARRLHYDPLAALLPDVEEPCDAWELLHVLRRLCSIRHGLEYERSRLLLEMHDRSLYRELSFRSAAQYVENGLGLAPREVRVAQDLQARVLACPGVARAWRDGEIDSTVAALLVRVVTRDTEAAWLRHAAAASFKRLQIEVDWHLACQSVLSWPEYLLETGGLPHPEIPTRRLLLDWQEFFGLREKARLEHASRRRRGRVVPGGACNAVEAIEATPELDDAPELLQAQRRSVTVSFYAPPSVAAQWRSAIRRVRETAGPGRDDGDCVHVMLIEFAHANAGEQTTEMVRRHAVFERDGWRCAMPGCRSRQRLHDHHVIFRAHGGSDEPWNRITLCSACHAHVVHEGRVAIAGNAPDDLTFCVGPLPCGEAREVWRREIRVSGVA